MLYIIESVLSLVINNLKKFIFFNVIIISPLTIITLIYEFFKLIFFLRIRVGEVAEWSNALVLKTSEGVTPPRVRIPPSPPSQVFLAFI